MCVPAQADAPIYDAACQEHRENSHGDHQGTIGKLYARQIVQSSGCRTSHEKEAGEKVEEKVVHCRYLRMPIY